MKYLALSLTLLTGCTPEMQSQFDSLCDGVRAAHSVLAGETFPKNVSAAFDTADVICTTKPKDIGSAVVTLAAVYLVISKYQEKVQ